MSTIFLSHNSLDKPVVEAFARAMKDAGLVPWLDKWDLRYGAPWQPQLLEAIRRSPCVWVFVGRHGPGRWQDLEVQAAVDAALRDPRRHVVPIILREGSLESWDFLGLLSGTMTDLAAEPPKSSQQRSEWLQGIRATVELLRARVPAAEAVDPTPMEIDPNVAPYRSLQPFDTSDAEWMFGRDEDVRGLLERLRGPQRFMCLSGPSGSGKSSLVRAGLIPAVLTGELDGRYAWKSLVIRPGQAPCRALAEAIVSLDSNDGNRTLAAKVRECEDLEAEIRRNPAALRGATNLVLGTQPGDSRLLLVIDQFEEVFTLASATGDAASREAARRDGQAFISTLLEATREEHGRIIVVTTLRADFLNHCLNVPELNARVAGSLRFVLPSMQRHQLLDAIVLPAARLGVTIDQAVKDELLDETDGQAGQLSLLQFALAELWKHRKDARLSYESYRRLGKIRQLITRTADRIFAQMTDEQQVVAFRLLGRLVHLGEETGDTRRRAKHDEVIDTKLQEDVLDHLTKHRIIIQSEDHMEIAHDVLIFEWKRLRDHIGKRREAKPIEQRLIIDAALWASSGTPHGELWAGGRLIRALELDRQGKLDLSHNERLFLDASKVRADHLRMRGRGVVLGLVVITITATIVGILAWRNADVAARAIRIAWSENLRAIKSSMHAWGSQRRADSGRLALTSSRQLASGNVEQAFLLAQEASKLATTINQHVPPALSALHIARVALGRAVILRVENGGIIRNAAFSFDGRSIVVAAADAPLHIWSWSDSGRELQTLTGSAGAARAFFDHDDQYVLDLVRNRAVRLWSTGHVDKVVMLEFDGVRDASVAPKGGPILLRGRSIASLWNRSGRRLAVLDDCAQGCQFSFSPDGNRIIGIPKQGPIWIWGADGREIVTLGGSDDVFRSATLDGDGKQVLTLPRKGTPIVWDMDGSVVRELGQKDESFLAASFNPHGREIVTVSSSGRASLWSSSMANPVVLHDAQTRSVAWSPDGRTIILTTRIGGIAAWSAKGERTLTFKGQERTARDAAFSPDGKYVFAMSQAKDALWIWSIDAPRAPWRLHGDRSFVKAIGFSAAGPRVATTPSPQASELHVQTLGKSEPLLLENGDIPALDVAFSPDARQLAAVSKTGKVRIWNTNATESSRELRGHEKAAVSIAYGPDGSRILTASNDGTARIWRVGSKRDPLVLRAHDKAVVDAVFSADGRRVATASLDTTARVWDLVGDDARPAWLLRGHHGPVVSVSFGRNGNRVATASWDETARVWDLREGGGATVIVLPHRSPLLWGSLDPTERYVATKSVNGDGWLWDTDEPGKPLALHVAGYRVTSVSFSADGTKLVATSEDGAARVWDIQEPDAPVVFRADDIPALTASFNALGDRIVVASVDGAVRVWSTGGRDDPLVLQSEGAAVRIASFSHDGHLVATAADDGTLLLWHLNAKWLARTGCTLVGRNLTCEEWKRFMPPKSAYHVTCRAWPAAEGAPCR